MRRRRLGLTGGLGGVRGGFALRVDGGVQQAAGGGRGQPRGVVDGAEQGGEHAAVAGEGARRGDEDRALAAGGLLHQRQGLGEELLDRAGARGGVGGGCEQGAQLVVGGQQRQPVAGLARRVAGVARVQGQAGGGHDAGGQAREGLPQVPLPLRRQPVVDRPGDVGAHRPVQPRAQRLRSGQQGGDGRVARGRGDVRVGVGQRPQVVPGRGDGEPGGQGRRQGRHGVGDRGRAPAAARCRGRRRGRGAAGGGAGRAARGAGRAGGGPEDRRVDRPGDGGVGRAGDDRLQPGVGADRRGPGPVALGARGGEQGWGRRRGSAAPRWSGPAAPRTPSCSTRAGRCGPGPARCSPCRRPRPAAARRSPHRCGRRRRGWSGGRTRCRRPAGGR